MDLKQRFESAVARSRELTRKPGNDELLQLYALFKQATEGNVAGERPNGFDIKAIAKYEAWREFEGKSKDDAMFEYIALVDKLHQQYA
ncbi:MAG TPA: acyl-CoA-binding protein [Chryseosolibacter sp.]|nr:acyl-CoA-binding protein [Chryseosolibacter sp.]